MPHRRDANYRKSFVTSCLSGFGGSQEVVAEWFDALDETCELVIGPAAAEVDRTGGQPAAAVEALRAVGAFGIQVPPEYGGLGFNNDAAALAVERVARSCPSSAAILMFHFQVVNRTLTYGHPDRQIDDLVSMGNGEVIAASAWTEPSASTDKTAVSTALRRGAGGLRIDGAKTYCTGLTSSSSIDVLLTAEHTDTPGPTFVRVDMKNAGVTITDVYPMLGLRGTGTGTVELNSVPASESDLLGSVGSATELMRDNHRTPLNPGLLALGIADSAFRDTLDMMSGSDARPQKPPSDSVHRMLAEAAVLLESAYAYASGLITRMSDETESAFQLASRLKVQSTAAAELVTSLLMRAAGSRGFLATYPLERHFRDAQAASLMGPPTEMCLQRISADLLPT